MKTGNLCPLDWNVPTDEEWKKLEMYISMSQETSNLISYRGTNEEGKLKSSIGQQQNGNGTNEQGFSALPSGWRNYGGD